MYGMDGNMSALAWAELCGLGAVSEPDREELIRRGYFTSAGVRTNKKVRVKTLQDS